jgi:hypothetical protein
MNQICPKETNYSQVCLLEQTVFSGNLNETRKRKFVLCVGACGEIFWMIRNLLFEFT